MNGSPSETIDRAAMLYKGVTYSLAPPARHADVKRLMTEDGLAPADIARATQGFRTSRDRFVTRSAALKIARAAGQVGAKTVNPRELFSEDLW